MESIIAAMLLGDGYMSKKKKTCRLGIEHSIKQIDYLKYKSEILSSYFGKVTMYHRRHRDGMVCIEKCKVSFYPLRDKFYPNGKKCMLTLLNSVSEADLDLALAIWLADDGRIASQIRPPYHARLGICTHSEDYETHIAILKILADRFGLVGNIYKEKRNKRIFANAKDEHYYIMFDKPNTKVIWDRIKPIIGHLESMQHKFRYIGLTYDQEYNFLPRVRDNS